ncbi:MAG: hypothetical protein M1829_004652 [Trizodia sp. TS-e1964]|nr:MAG: hypothetical protein M1829_004652 [Trizodia sp. TS-e1964]
MPPPSRMCWMRSSRGLSRLISAKPAIQSLRSARTIPAHLLPQASPAAPHCLPMPSLAPPPLSTRAPRGWEGRIRRFSTQTGAPSTTPAQSRTRAVLNPRFDASGQAQLIDISPRAAKRLKELLAKEVGPRCLLLRFTVEPGGCHGFQYNMSLDSRAAGAEDTVFEYFDVDNDAAEMPEGERRAGVVMDAASLDLLQGSTVDFTQELIGSQFRIANNPKATSSCGCGTSFDISQ